MAACFNNKPDEPKKTEQSEAKTVSISDGAKEMKQTITELKAQLTANEAAKVKESGTKLEQ